jgi:hypothetical protein
MCYFLSIASPLTLSEIRSMLPPGLTADLVPSSERIALLRLHPAAKTVAHLLVGACSCDLVRPRIADAIEDERELRRRYQRGKLSRPDIIRLLERHRRGPLPRPTATRGWASALAAFVVEHARNAGPTLYILEFVPATGQRGSLTTPATCTVADVRMENAAWLAEGRPVLVR